MILDYIPDDGYTEAGFILSIPQLHNSVKFTYRPMLIEDQTRWMEESKKFKDDTWSRRAAMLMADRIKSWNILDQTGDVLPITDKNVILLKPSLFMRLYGICLGTDSSDIDPDWSSEEKNSNVNTQKSAIEYNTNFGIARDKNDVKN